MNQIVAVAAAINQLHKQGKFTGENCMKDLETLEQFYNRLAAEGTSLEEFVQASGYPRDFASIDQLIADTDQEYTDWVEEQILLAQQGE